MIKYHRQFYRKFFKQVPIFFIFLQLFFAVTAFAKTIVIYHTSDVHGAYLPVQTANGLSGGFAALASLVKKEKSPYVLLDSGDWFQGTPEGNLSQGRLSIEMMNLLGYKAAVAGNHDLDYSPENLAALTGAAKFPVLGANVYDKNTGLRVGYLKPYSVVDIDGIKLGLIGLLTEETSVCVIAKYVKGLSFRDKAAEAAALLPELKRQGVNTVIVLTHSGFPRGSLNDIPDNYGNLAIARQAPGIALVLGGHTHNRSGQGYRDSVSGALFVESGASLNSVSRITLEFSDTDGAFLRADSKLLSLKPEKTGSDPETEKALKEATDSISAQMEQVIGTLPFNLSRSRHGAEKDSALGNWLTDLMREKSGADIAFLNTPGIRSDLQQGPVKARDVYQVMPFDNTLATLSLTGAQVFDVMRGNISKTGCLISVSGLRVNYSLNEQGVLQTLEIKTGDEFLKQEKIYKIAVTDFLAGGGLGGEVFPSGTGIKDTGLVIRQLILERFRARQDLIKPDTGRVTEK